MDHPRTAKLDPSRAFARTATGGRWLALGRGPRFFTAHCRLPTANFPGAVTFETREIELGRRLREGEIARTETRSRVLPKKPSEPFGNRPLEMRHGDPLIDAQSL